MKINGPAPLAGEASMGQQEAADSQQRTNANATYTLTVGRGKSNATGTRVSIAAPPLDEYSDDLVEGYLGGINAIQVGEEAWFSTHDWNGTRGKSNWTSSWGIGIDLDYIDPRSTYVDPEKGKIVQHCPMPAEFTEKVEASIASCPGSIYYPTARGVRVIFVADRAIQDAATYQQAAEGASADLWEYVQKAGLSAVEGVTAGLTFDPCVFDTARMYYAPKAIVNGVRRDATARKLAAIPYSVASLTAKAPQWLRVNPKAKAPPAQSSTDLRKSDSAPARVQSSGRAGRGSRRPDAVEAARKRFNADYLQEHGPWPKAPGARCFACGSDGFGENKLNPSQWYCFSTNHVSRPGVEVGHQRRQTEQNPSDPPGWCGDALDKVMFEQGLTTAGVTAQEALTNLRDDVGLPYLDASDVFELALDSGLKPFTVEELSGEPPALEFLWESVLPAKKVSVIAAGGATGKTSMLVGLAVHRALGKPFLGWNVKEGKTLIITAEDDRDDFWRKLKAWQKVMGPDFDMNRVAERVLVQELLGTDCALVEGRGGTFSVREEVARALVSQIKRNAPDTDLVILETASRFGVDESNSALAALNRAVEYISRRTGAAVLIVTHVSKQAGREGTSDAYAARGGSAMTDNARSGLVLTKLDAKRAKSCLGFDPPEEDLKKLLLLDLTKLNYAPERRFVVLEKVRTSYAGGLVVRPYTPVRSAEDIARGQRVKRGGLLLEVLRKLKEQGYSDVSMNKLQTDHLQLVQDIAHIGRNALPKVVGEAVEDGFLEVRDRAGRGGGKVYLPTGRLSIEPVLDDDDYVDEI